LNLKVPRTFISAPIFEHLALKRHDTEQRAARRAAGVFLPLPTHARGSSCWPS